MVLRGFYYPLAFHFRIVKIISKHLLSQFSRSVWLFVTPWTAARQASLSIPNSRSSLRLMSIESVMPSNHLILCCPLLLLPSIFPNIRVFSNEMLTPWKESYDQPRQHIKKHSHYFANKGSSSQGYGFPSSHVWMWELDCKESWVLKKWCFWSVVLEKTLESLLYCKEIQPVHPKGDQSWVFFGRTHVEAEAPIIWPPNVKSWVIWKDPDAGKDWRQKEKGTAEDEMVGWHYRLDGNEFE